MGLLDRNPGKAQACVAQSSLGENLSLLDWSQARGFASNKAPALSCHHCKSRIHCLSVPVLSGDMDQALKQTYTFFPVHMDMCHARVVGLSLYGMPLWLAFVCVLCLPFCPFLFSIHLNWAKRRQLLVATVRSGTRGGSEW